MTTGSKPHISSHRPEPGKGASETETRGRIVSGVGEHTAAGTRQQTYLRSKDRDATFHQRGLEKGQFNQSKEPSAGSVGCGVW
jgi:hypothetical protein